jgi:hypothetical protein
LPNTTLTDRTQAAYSSYPLDLKTSLEDEENMRARIIPTTSLLLALVLPVLGSAEEKPAPTPCQSDIQNLCKKAQGEAAVSKCLQENGTKITVGCKTHLDEMAEYKAISAQVTNMRTTCKSDLATLCPAVPPGEGKQLQCLRAQSEKLSPACKDVMVKSGVMDLKPVPTAVPTATPEPPTTAAPEVTPEAAPDAIPATKES